MLIFIVDAKKINHALAKRGYKREWYNRLI